MCGDEITVYLNLDGDIIKEITFQGQGCAISKASASLMTESLMGKTVEEAQSEFKRVMDMLTQSEEEPDSQEMGEIVALSGVRKFPARIKCATLAWHAATAALEGRDRASTE